MSHSVTLTVKLNENQIFEINSICEDAFNFLNNVKSKYSNIGIKNFIDKTIKTLNEERKKAEGFYQVDNNNKDFKLEEIKNSIIKSIENIKSSVNSSSIYSFFEFTRDDTKLDLSHWISKYGTIVFEAINTLKVNNKLVNDEMVGQTIDQIINRKTSELYKKSFLEQVRNSLDEKSMNEMDNSIKSQLFIQAKKLNSYQEMNDYLAYIKSKQYNQKGMIKLAKKIYEGLKTTSEYSQVSKRKSILDSDGKLVHIYSFKNNFNESFDLKIDETLHITYKIGDYERHCCKQTSDQIWKYLEEHDVQIVNKKIFREFSNAKPLYKSIDKKKEK